MDNAKFLFNQNEVDSLGSNYDDCKNVVIRKDRKEMQDSITQEVKPVVFCLFIISVKDEKTFKGK